MSDAHAPGPATSVDVLDTRAAGRLVIRGGALRVVGYGLGVALSLVAAAILIRELGAAQYGRYVTVISLITIVGSIAEAGMTNLAIREYSTLAGTERDRLMRDLLGLRLLIAAAGVALALAFTLVAGYTRTMVLGTLVAGAGAVIANVQMALSVPLSSTLALGRVTVVELLRQVATLAVTVGLALLGAGLLAFLAVQVPAGIVALAATVWWVRGAIPLLPSVNLATWRRLLGVLASFALATAVGTLYVYVVVVVMSLVSSETETGYFGAAFRVFLVAASISGLLMTSAFPVLARAARDDRERLAYALQRMFEVAVILGTGIALVTVIGAPVAIDAIAGPDFAPAVGTLRIQALAIVASFLLSVWAFALISLHLHRALLLANALAFAVSVALSLALAPGHGADGAAVATVAGETVLAAAYAVALMRHRPELRPSLGTAWKVAPAVALAATAGAVPPFAALPATIVAGAVFLAVTLALRAIPAELYEALPRRGRGAAA